VNSARKSETAAHGATVFTLQRSVSAADEKSKVCCGPGSCGLDWQSSATTHGARSWIASGFGARTTPSQIVGTWRTARLRCHRGAAPERQRPPLLIVPAPIKTAYIWELLEYEGDVGIMLQHLGMLVGEGARRSPWPRILDWMRSRASF
jgi:hypothetical protein